MQSDLHLHLWLLLFFAIILGLFNKKLFSFILLYFAVFSAYDAKLITGMAILYGLLGLALAALIPYTSKPWKQFAWLILLFWCAVLLLHQFPGFTPQQVLSNVQKSPNSASFDLYLNLDKPLVFFALLFAYPPLLGKYKTIKFGVVVQIFIGLIGLLLLATSMELIKIEHALPAWIGIYILNNLLITCVTEEAFFRGFLQQAIVTKMNAIIGIIITSVIFGLAHYAGNIDYVIFAIIAGLFYGLAFQISRQLWVAILIHFFFNLTHLLFFTYPYLLRV